jgi:hypothetical protein
VKKLEHIIIKTYKEGNMEKKSYAGEIKNTGTQTVQALYKTPATNKNVVKKGGDLRSKGGTK